MKFAVEQLYLSTIEELSFIAICLMILQAPGSGREGKNHGRRGKDFVPELSNREIRKVNKKINERYMTNGYTGPRLRRVRFGFYEHPARTNNFDQCKKVRPQRVLLKMNYLF